MTNPEELQAVDSLTLAAATAADLMTPNPVSIGQNATVKEAAAFLTDRGFSAAPVIDEAGRPVGVVSRADIVVHHRQKAEPAPAVPDYYERTDLATRSGEPLPGGSQAESTYQASVRDIMTPVVFAVPADAPARRVVGDMLGLKVHRVFVVDAAGDTWLILRTGPNSLVRVGVPIYPASEADIAAIPASGQWLIPGDGQRVSTERPDWSVHRSTAQPLAAPLAAIQAAVIAAATPTPATPPPPPVEVASAPLISALPPLSVAAS